MAKQKSAYVEKKKYRNYILIQAWIQDFGKRDAKKSLGMEMPRKIAPMSKRGMQLPNWTPGSTPVNL